jgi:hypothetical protein
MRGHTSSDLRWFIYSTDEFGALRFRAGVDVALCRRVG